MIFIVDDSYDDIELTSTALEFARPGIKVKSVSNGKSALEFLRSVPSNLPSMILLDVKMPGMSGVDTLKEIRKDQSLHDMPVVIVTSSLLESDKEAAFQAGASDFLHKSFSFEIFCDELKALLDRWLPAYQPVDEKVESP